MTEVETHGDWLVWHDPLPIAWRGADWRYVHKDATDDIDIGTAESKEMCLQSIDYIESEALRAETSEGKTETKRIVDSGMCAYNRVLLAMALKPFAKVASPWVKQGSLDNSPWAQEPDETILVIGREDARFNRVTVGDLRRAAAAFEQYQEQT